MKSIVEEVKKVARKSVVKSGGNGSPKKSVITSEMIAKKAYELYEKRGCQNGNPEQDWLEAKRILEAGE